MRKTVASGLLILAALGVVFGDIGTSPLYAVNQIFLGGPGALGTATDSVLGAISLIFWALTIMVTFKYVLFVLLADHNGQGGVFALLGLLEEYRQKILVGVLLLVLLLSAGLLLGEGVMTPAISVLAAVEGLAFANSAIAPYTIIITLAILCGLFAFQYKGTHRIGIVFGPVIALWFIVLALLGLREISTHPEILWALNPLYGIRLLLHIPFHTLFYVLSGVVLSVAGVEALYADLGHFGMRVLRRGWLWFAYPALLLNYLGQGAYVLGAGTLHTPSIFYATVPGVFIYPMIILATLATVVASQAFISGAYSIVAQATALHYLPRLKITHTNRQKEGQIYLSAVNWFLFTGSALLVIVFGSSTALASAYGFAIAAVMFTTTLAVATVAVLWWKWPLWRSVLVFGIFGIIDGTFVVTMSSRFWEGGWVPVAIGGIFFTLMLSWNWGRRAVVQAVQNYKAGRSMSGLVTLKKRLTTGEGVVADERGRFVEADRAVVFLVPNSITALEDEVPIIVRTYMRRNGAIPKHLILLHIDRSRYAYVRKTRYAIIPFGNNIWSVTANFGFMEEVNLHAIIADLVNDIPILKHDRFLVEAGSEEVHATKQLIPFNRLRLRVFRLLQRVSTPTYRYFGIESSTSLSTTTLHIYIDDKGASVRLPELDLL